MEAVSNVIKKKDRILSTTFNYMLGKKKREET